jgi:hypothetical protein
MSGTVKIHNLLAPEKRTEMADIIDEYERKRKNDLKRIRSIVDYTMGVLFLGLGIFFFIRYERNIYLKYIGSPDVLDIVLGVLFTLYGGWRIYRGYKKNYFR